MGQISEREITCLKITGFFIQAVGCFLESFCHLYKVQQCIFHCSLDTGLPQWLRWLSVCLQSGRPGFNPWVRKICWRRKCEPIPVSLPGKSHGRRSLVGYSPWGHKESDMTEQRHFLPWPLDSEALLNTFSLFSHVCIVASTQRTVSPSTLLVPTYTQAHTPKLSLKDQLLIFSRKYFHSFLV